MSDLPGLDRATTLPAVAYHDPAWLAGEREAIFARTWQLAGFRAHLREPGDYVTHDIAGYRILIIVADDGTLRGFHNVCRHRAGPLVTEDAGRCAAIVCAYHGWRYDFEGTLTRAREFGDAADFATADFALFPLAIDEWRGMVFVRIAQDGPRLAESLGGLIDRCADQPIESLTYSRRLTHTIDANWKTYTDNYAEGYHIPFVHPGLHAQIQTREYRVHVGDGFAEHSAPTRDGAVAAGLWLWQFPNLALNLYPEGMNVERWLPDGPGRTTVIYDCFVLDPSATAANDDIVRLGVEVLDEDRRICELVQRNLEAGIYTEGRLSPRHENCVYAFQSWVRTALDALPTGLSPAQASSAPAQASSAAGSRSSASELMQ